MGSRQRKDPSGLGGVILLMGGLGCLGFAGFLMFTFADPPWLGILIATGLGGMITWVSIRGIMSPDFRGVDEGVTKVISNKVSFGIALVAMLMGVSTIGYSGFLAFFLNPADIKIWGPIIFAGGVGVLFTLIGIVGLLSNDFGGGRG